VPPLLACGVYKRAVRCRRAKAPAAPTNSRSMPPRAARRLSPVLGRVDDDEDEDEEVADVEEAAVEEDVVAAGADVLDVVVVAAVLTVKSLNPKGIGVSVLPPSLAVTPT
jgi:hypothetical protein